VSRLPVAAFGALVLATVAAFFVTQHLKVSTPLISGDPKAIPATISPNETGCGSAFRSTRFSFYLLHRADDVDVYVVDQSGTIVRTLASGRHMTIRPPVRDFFPWNGRRDDGSLAPDGTYYYRIALLQQGRTITWTKTPVTVKSTPPRPVVTSVTPSLIPDRGIPPTISYRGNEGRRGTVRIYRTDLAAGWRLVASLPAPARPAARASWNGMIAGRPAPAGTYLAGLDVTDSACNTGHFPASIPPKPASTPHAGVTVRYLAAQPPLDPVSAGSTTLVYVDSRHRPYSWALQRTGVRRPAATGTGRGYALRVRVPAAAGAGLYELSLSSGAHQTTVPVIAGAHAGQRSASILVVLPALTWQGENPGDEDGDGLPDTLSAGGPIELQRPLANGLPVGFAGEAGLIAYLDRAHLPYDLTTDLGLIDGLGPALSGHRGVVLAGSERWLPSPLSSALRSYVQGGGHVLSLGIDSLRRGVTVQGGRALDPTQPQAADAFGARAGPVVTGSSELITEAKDGLGIFSHTSGALAGFRDYQPIASVAPPAQPIASAAGTSASTAAIAGYRLGGGTVVEVGLGGFGSSLAANIDSQELIGRLWAVLSSG